ATTSPGPSVRPRASPSAAVSSGELERRLTAGTERRERGRQRLDEVARDQRLLPLARSGDVAGESVQVHGADERVGCSEAAGEEGAHDAGEHVAGAAAGHAG